MATTPTTTTPPRSSGDGSGWGAPPPNGGGGPDGRAAGDTHLLGMALGLTGVAMLFIALTSAYVVRQGSGADWRRLHVPPVIWFNTAALLAGSLTFERARSLFVRRPRGTRRWLAGTLALGLAFVTGQIFAWRSLAQQGLYLDSNPHASFFYVMSGVHALHVFGGIGALAWLVARLRDPANARNALGATCLYWHFMDALWIYLVALLFYWS